MNTPCFLFLFLFFHFHTFAWAASPMRMLNFISLSYRISQSFVCPHRSSQFSSSPVELFLTTTCLPSKTMFYAFPTCVHTSGVIVFPWTVHSLRVLLCFHQWSAGEPQPVFCQAGPARAQLQFPLSGFAGGSAGWGPVGSCATEDSDLQSTCVLRPSQQAYFPYRPLVMFPRGGALFPGSGSSAESRR